MILFDSHAHYDDEAFDKDRKEVLDSLTKKGIGFVVNAASDVESTKKSIALSMEYDFIYASAGVHPHEASKDNDIDEIKRLALSKKVVAIGEIGLDYHYDFSPAMVQQQVFEKQLQAAYELCLPVIIHNREAHKDSLDMVRRFNGIKGVFHCFSGSPEMAQILIKLGMYISFAGALTFKNAKRAVQTAMEVPFDRILIETDCPYLTPEPYRGKRNDSGYLYLTLEKLADIKGVNTKEAACITYENGRRLFGI